jgi:hypothetical protein
MVTWHHSWSMRIYLDEEDISNDVGSRAIRPRWRWHVAHATTVHRAVEHLMLAVC